MALLVTARVLQGIGGGALQPLAQAILLESFPPAKRGQAMASFGVGVIVAPVIGPTLGGWLTDTYSWRWVFNINIPIGMLALYLMQRNVEDPPYIKHAKPGRIDGIGFGLLALWIATLQIVLEKGSRTTGSKRLGSGGSVLISVAGLVAFIVRELRAKEPIVNLRVFLNRNFWIGTSLMTLFGAALYSTVAMVPAILADTGRLLGAEERDREQSARVGFAGGDAAGSANDREVGCAMDARNRSDVCSPISSFLIGNLNAEIGMANIVWPIVLQGFGMGFIFVPLTTMTVSMLANTQMGNATGMYNLMRNLGGSIGISVATTYLARGAQAHQVYMVAHMTPYDPGLPDAFAGDSGGAHSLHGRSASATTGPCNVARHRDAAGVLTSVHR